MATIIQDSRITVLDDNGDPVSGAKLYFFDAGTTTPRAVYTDAALSVAHTVPIVCDSGGVAAQVFIDPTAGNYKFKVTDSDDVQLYEDDDISVALSGIVSMANGGTGADTQAGAQAALNVSSSTVTDGYNTRITNLETANTAGEIWDYDAQTFAASFTPNIANIDAVSTTLTSNMTVNVPSGGVAGKVFILKLAQDATGNRTIALNAAYKPQAGSINLSWSNGPNEVDILFCQYISASEIRIISFVAEGRSLRELGALYNAATSFSTASTSYADVTGMSLTVTPKDSSATLILEGVISCSHDFSGKSYYRLLRDGAPVSGGDITVDAYGHVDNLIRSAFYIELPSTATSSTIFKLQTKVVGGTAYLNRSTSGTYAGTSYMKVSER